MSEEDFSKGRLVGLHEALEMIHAEIDCLSHLPKYAQKGARAEAAVFDAATAIFRRIRLRLDEPPRGLTWDMFQSLQEMKRLKKLPKLSGDR
jgi:hypothetical protein